jgi:hypothetical protein
LKSKILIAFDITLLLGLSAHASCGLMPPKATDDLISLSVYEAKEGHL